MTAFETVSWIALTTGLVCMFLGWRWFIKAGALLEEANACYDAALAHRRGELMHLRRVARRQRPDTKQEGGSR